MAVALALVFGSLLWFAPSLIEPGWLWGHDSRAHATYMYVFDAALRQGQFPVRWVELIGDGKSQPLFNFYQPGLYYLASAVHLIVPSLAASLKLTVLLCWWLGALFAFLLCRRWGTMAGAAAALAFAYSPYLALNVYVRAAYAEVAGIAWGVGVLWLLDAYLRLRDRRYLPPLAVVIAITLVSHLAASMAIAAVACVLVVVAIARRDRPGPRGMAWLLLAVALGAGLGAFFWAPAIGELDFVRTSMLTTADGDYHRHFIYPHQWLFGTWDYGASRPGPDDGLSFQLGIVPLIALGAAAVLAFVTVARRFEAAWRVPLLTWVAITATALFLMTDNSAGLWADAWPLRFLQFPWRLLLVVSIGGSVLAGILVGAIRRPALQAIIVICAVVAAIVSSKGHFVPGGVVAVGDLSIDNPDWRETTTAESQGFVEMAFFPRTTPLSAIGASERWTVTAGEGKVHGVRVTDDRFFAIVDAPEGLCLTVNSHFYPGWMVRIDGVEAPFTVSPRTGFIEIDLPSGHHRLEAAFVGSMLVRSANIVSVVSALLVVAWWAWSGLIVYRSRAAARVARSAGTA